MRFYISRYFFQFTLTNKGSAIGLLQLLYKSFYFYSAGGFCKKGKFIQVFHYFLFLLAFLNYTNQYGSFFCINSLLNINQGKMAFMARYNNKLKAVQLKTA